MVSLIKDLEAQAEDKDQRGPATRSDTRQFFETRIEIKTPIIEINPGRQNKDFQFEQENYLQNHLVAGSF